MRSENPNLAVFTTSIYLCDLFAAHGLSLKMLIVVGRLEGAVYFSSSSMLVASSVELVRQVRLMEVNHYKKAVIDEKMLDLENLHSDMMVKIGDSDM